jgi:hypothetical protein
LIQRIIIFYLILANFFNKKVVKKPDVIQKQEQKVEKLEEKSNNR